MRTKELPPVVSESVCIYSLRGIACFGEGPQLNIIKTPEGKLYLERLIFEDLSVAEASEKLSNGVPVHYLCIFKETTVDELQQLYIKNEASEQGLLMDDVLNKNNGQSFLVKCLGEETEEFIFIDNQQENLIVEQIWAERYPLYLTDDFNWAFDSIKRDKEKKLPNTKDDIISFILSSLNIITEGD